MTKMLDLLQRLQERSAEGKTAIEGKRFLLIEACKNEYITEELPTIPAGTTVECDFVCDSGMYAIADVQGRLHKVLIPLKQLHLIDFNGL